MYGDQDDGHDVDAYIIDTGIRVSHSDFEGRAVWGMVSENLLDQSQADLNGHGTHVAGTVGGKRLVVMVTGVIYFIQRLIFSCAPLSNCRPTNSFKMLNELNWNDLITIEI